MVDELARQNMCSMKNRNEVLNTLPAERRAKIEGRTAQLIADEILEIGFDEGSNDCLVFHYQDRGMVHLERSHLLPSASRRSQPALISRIRGRQASKAAINDGSKCVPAPSRKVATIFSSGQASL